MDFDVGDYLQAYLAFRADHNEDFDTIAGPTTWTGASPMRPLFPKQQTSLGAVGTSV
jgi:hypothetical protein